MGVKFGVQEGTFAPNFTPIGATTKGVGAPKQNFYSDLTKIWNINASQGRIPCAIFRKLAEFVPHFRMH